MGRGYQESCPASRLTARAKFWLELDGRYVFGLGMRDLLKAVQDTGSIRAAAEELNTSYRYTWGKLKEAEQALGFRLVRARRGGKGVCRSELTPLARNLVVEFDALRERFFEIVESEFQKRIQASLDGAVERVRDTGMEAGVRPRAVPQLRGSGGRLVSAG
jgi:molybdate transport system regulatory protein